MKTIFFSLIFLILTISFGYAQGDFSYQATYRENILLDQEVVSGGYYVDPAKNIEGHPYFDLRNFEKGNIQINGMLYTEVPLLYDIWQDEVLTFQPIHSKKILIRADKVEQFILEHTPKRIFIRLDENPGYTFHRNGYYELLAGEELQLLTKHYKQTKANRDNLSYTDVFYEKSDFFLKKGNEIQLIRKRKQARDFLGLDNKALRDIFKGKNLRFKADKKAYLSVLVEYINQKSQ
ncbi:hypothetical protein A33Q_0063 [Indibacter alkaliphilus LW1]|uniref:Uncharacterized protein n=1 Tax=Indibacter alkaliphilus (strain CCUG 57479 / KCTC 22604 / LW1) TaxID=1189612 RepID=S2DNE6_INDAL|nr:hypothetical protein [Indibacter alkaliphilus]EPA00590.1 hypothetical protein A33Q_0063 [Indibacter alkaliphilus LW1]